MRGQRHAPAAPYPRERPGTHFTGGRVSLRAGLERCEKSRPTGIRSPDRPARRHSLYRLRYPAHCGPIIDHKYYETCAKFVIFMGNILAVKDGVSQQFKDRGSKQEDYISEFMFQTF